MRSIFPSVPFSGSSQENAVTCRASPWPHHISLKALVCTMQSVIKTLEIVPPSRERTAKPRWESRTIQSLIMTLVISPTDSVPSVMAPEVDLKKQLLMITLSTRPYCEVAAHDFKEMQSSAVSKWQLVIRTSWQRSISMPSPFGTMRSLKIRMPLISKLLQPVNRTAQKAGSVIVTSTIFTP